MKTVTGSLLALTIGVGLAALPLTGGCEHELSHNSETVQHPDGTVSHPIRIRPSRSSPTATW